MLVNPGCCPSDMAAASYLLRRRHASYSARVPVSPPTATLLPSGFQARLVVVYRLSTCSHHMCKPSQHNIQGETAAALMQTCHATQLQQHLLARGMSAQAQHQCSAQRTCLTAMCCQTPVLLLKLNTYSRLKAPTTAVSLLGLMAQQLKSRAASSVL